MSVEYLTGILFVAFTLGTVMIISASSTGLSLYRQRVLDQMQTQMTSLFMFNDAARWSLAYLASLLLMPALLFFIGANPVLIVIGAVGLLLVPRVLFAMLRARRAKAISQALPDALLQIASGMRAGSTFTVALQNLAEEDTSPLGDELSLTLREHRIGARMEDAMENLAERVRSEEIDLVVSAVLIAQDVGGNLAEILQGLAQTLRQKMEMEGKIRSLTSQGMMQGYVVSALPMLILTILSLIEPEVTLPIFTGLLGWMTLGVMVVVQLIGAFVIKRIVTIEV